MSDSNGRGSSQSLAAIVQSAADGIVTADEAGLIMSWNPAASRMFGWSDTEVVGKSLSVIVPERFRTAHNEGLAHVVASGETKIIGKTVEVFGLHKGGKEFPIELSLATWIDGGRRFFSGIIRDITVRTELTSDLMRSEQRLQAIMRSANDAVVSIDGKGLWRSGTRRRRPCSVTQRRRWSVSPLPRSSPPDSGKATKPACNG